MGFSGIATTIKANTVSKVRPAWNSHDYALWHTCELLAESLDGLEHRPELPQVLTPFPLQISHEEGVLAASGYRDYIWAAPGDGSYDRSSGFFFATGGLGMALTAGSMIGRAAGNSSRRRQAAVDAQPRWLLTDAGQIYVTTHAIYLHSNQGLRVWDWDSMDSCQVQSRCVQIAGQSTTGPTKFMIESDYAELIFAIWALYRHPQHPQLVQGTWLPHNWLQRAHDAGYPTRLNRYQLS